MRGYGTGGSRIVNVNTWGRSKNEILLSSLAYGKIKNQVYTCTTSIYILDPDEFYIYHSLFTSCEFHNGYQVVPIIQMNHIHTYIVHSSHKSSIDPIKRQSNGRILFDCVIFHVFLSKWMYLKGSIQSYMLVDVTIHHYRGIGSIKKRYIWRY